MILNEREAHSIVCGAVRYYLGRHTIAVHGVADTLIELLPQIPSNTKDAIERDISRWLEENPVYVWAGVDDAEPWRKLLRALRDEKEKSHEVI